MNALLESSTALLPKESAVPVGGAARKKERCAPSTREGEGETCTSTCNGSSCRARPAKRHASHTIGRVVRARRVRAKANCTVLYKRGVAASSA